MNNFARAVRLSLKYRFTLSAAFVCSLLVAVLWGANIGTVYPLIQIVFKGQTLQEWVQGKIDVSENKVAELQRSIAELKNERLSAPGDRQDELEKKLALAEGDLVAEQRAVEISRWIQPTINKVLPDDPFLTLVYVLMFLLLGTLIKDFFLVGNSILISRLVQLASLDLRNQFYRHTLEMDMCSFGRHTTSSLMSRFTADLGSVSGGVGTLFGDTMREPLKIIVCLIGAAVISWRLLLLSLVLTPVAVILTGRLAKSIKRANRRSLEETSELYGRLSETFSGIQAVKAFTMERHERSRFNQVGRKLYRRAMQLTMYGALTKPINEFLGIGIVCLALAAGGYLVLNHQTHLFGIRMTGRPLDFGAMMAFFAFLAGISDPARKMTGIFQDLQRAAAASDRVFPLLDQVPTIKDPPQPRSLSDGQHEIVFDHVSFHYLPDQPVLHDINLRIPFGETLAIVGPNGCGKSTLANLLPRFYDPEQGAVRLGFHDLREFRVRDLRKRIGMVTQQTLLFNDTVLDNIRYGSPNATDEEVKEAAQKALAHQFIEEELDLGYQTVVGERGNRLSGGQRQRIALARAILRDPAILILDEATSQIDPKSEHLIQLALEQFTRDRTAIIITHRMSTLSLADRILVMDAGRIVDVGTHDELLARCDVYRRLHRTDFKESA